MAFPSVTRAQALGEMKQGFRFDINFQPIVDVISKFVTYPLPNAENLSLLCTSSNLPKKLINQAEMQFRNNVKIYQAGLMEVSGTTTFTFFDTITNEVMNLIDNWGNLEGNTLEGLEGTGFSSEGDMNSWGAAESPENYKCNLTIIRVDGKKNAIYGYKYLGCSYQDHDPGGDVDAATGDVTKPTLTIQYDAYVRLKAPAVG